MSTHGLVDYHMHTAVSVDAHMSEIDACQRAVALGLREICFTNHVMLAQPNYLMSAQQLVDHWGQIQACQQRFPELTIRLGLEMDYYEGREDQIAATIRRYEALVERPLDYVLGAVHELNGVFFSSSKFASNLFAGGDVEAVFRDYFRLMSRAARSGLFDVMAHPDLIKKYTNRLHSTVPFASYRDTVEAFITSVLDAGVGIEINPKGLKYTVAEVYPSDQFLALYLREARERGVEPIITLGSDAHRSEDVGARLVEGVASLRRAGHHSLSLFQHHQRIPLRLA